MTRETGYSPAPGGPPNSYPTGQSGTPPPPPLPQQPPPSAATPATATTIISRGYSPSPQQVVQASLTSTIQPSLGPSQTPPPGTANTARGYSPGPPGRGYSPVTGSLTSSNPGSRASSVPPGGVTSRLSGVSCPAPSFHNKNGQLVALSHSLRTATRNNATQEFNHGLVFSSFALQDNQIFEVRIDKKINSWSGSIEVGVTCCDPNALDTPFPSSATELREGTWIMSGNSVLRDGRSINENYGTDLDKLEEGDKVGVLKTGQGDLIFFVNGVSQGVAASNLPSRVFAVIDMYGKCAQVTIMDNSVQEARIQSNDRSNVATAAQAASTHLNSITANNSINNITNANIQAATVAATAAVSAATSSGIAAASISGLIRDSILGNVPGVVVPTVSTAANTTVAAVTCNTNGTAAATNGCSGVAAMAAAASNNRIRFCDRHGTLIKLGNNNRTAERKRPFDEFNNGVVMTHRPLRDNELFEIRLDRLVNKWSGSLEVGVTTFNPCQFEFPGTMTNLRHGTTMMSGAGILTNGKGTRREYGEFNLDELCEGDRIGMMRRSNGDLHYFINGLDQGVAASRLPGTVWGVVDLYGMAVKVTIVDRDERDEQNLITRRNLGLRPNRESLDLQPPDKLVFHPACGSHAAVINSGITAHRPNAADDFNFGVVLTNRPLKPNEMFEVRLDKMVAKWAGSIEIGVTTHAPSDLEFPSTMTNIRSGTWMMTGNGVMHNGTTTFDEYGQNLDKLKVGDRVGVMRKESGVLHFYVNGDDQGPAATNVPDRVYGVIDLYGQAAQATIIDGSEFRSPDGLDSTVTSGTMFSHIDSLQDLRFHHLHGRNARISNSGSTAARQNALSEFNEAIVMSNRALRDGELFEIQVERMVDRWSGSIEAGVTSIKPEDLEFPNTMTDIDYDTWMLSGSAVMKDGNTVKNNYGCDLDSLNVGHRLGMMRTAEGALHYFINGEDQGVAMENVPAGVYAVIDLYGVCAQVSVLNRGLNRTVTAAENSLASSQIMESSQASLPLAVMPGGTCAAQENQHRFCSAVGKSLEISASCMTVCKKDGMINALLTFSAHQLDTEEMFEVRVDRVDNKWAGALKIGLTTFDITDGDSNKVPAELSGLEDVVYLDGTNLVRNNTIVRMNYGPCLDRLNVGDKVGVRRTEEGNIRFTINGEDQGVASTNVPSNVRAVIELTGHISQVTVSSVGKLSCSPNVEESNHLLVDSLENIQEGKEINSNKLEFHDNRGRNVQLSDENTVARRTESYNQGIVVSHKHLVEDQLFQVHLTKINPKWSSSISLGVIGIIPERLHFPVSILHFKKETWALAEDKVHFNGNVINKRYGPNLDTLAVNHTVGVMVDRHRNLRFYVNGVDQGVAAKNLPKKCWAVFDLYGMCEEIAITDTHSYSSSINQNIHLTENVSSKEKWNEEEDQERLIDRASKDLKNSVTSTHNNTTTPAQLTTSQQQLLTSSQQMAGNGNQLTSSQIGAANALTGSQLLQASANAPLTKQDLFTLKSRRNCDYFNVCRKFKNSLGLPNYYFDKGKTSDGVCFCEACHKLRGSAGYASAGDPPKSLDLPINWVLFPLRSSGGDAGTGGVDGGNEEGGVTKEAWHLAYHGTSIGNIRPMLDAGMKLLTVRELGLQRTLEKEKSKEDDSDVPLLRFSPDVSEASAPQYSPRRTFKPKGCPEGNVYNAKSALLLELEPGSYKIGGKEDGESENIWVSKERGNTSITALLVALEDDHTASSRTRTYSTYI